MPLNFIYLLVAALLNILVIFLTKKNYNEF